MTYQTAAFLSQMIAMAIFGTVFAGVLVYVFWPGNKQRLDRASRIPLDADSSDAPTGADR
jgi:cytochrome c oxidase cbb3-type subunit 4